MAGDRILIVDDEKLLRRSLKMALADEGFTVETEGTGEAALAAMEGVQPHLVLLDLRLPGMDGLVGIQKYLGRLN